MKQATRRYVVRCAEWDNPFSKRTVAEARAKINDRDGYCGHQHTVVEQVWRDGAWVDA